MVADRHVVQLRAGLMADLDAVGPVLFDEDVPEIGACFARHQTSKSVCSDRPADELVWANRFGDVYSVVLVRRDEKAISIDLACEGCDAASGVGADDDVAEDDG